MKGRILNVSDTASAEPRRIPGRETVSTLAAGIGTESRSALGTAQINPSSKDGETCVLI